MYFGTITQTYGGGLRSLKPWSVPCKKKKKMLGLRAPLFAFLHNSFLWEMYNWKNESTNLKFLYIVSLIFVSNCVISKNCTNYNSLKEPEVEGNIETRKFEPFFFILYTLYEISIWYKNVKDRERRCGEGCS